MKIGDYLIDNDPRMYGGRRSLVIIEVDDTHVTARQGGLRPVKIRKDRIYSDDKPRRSGFDLVETEEGRG